MTENALRPTRQTESFVLSGPAPAATGNRSTSTRCSRPDPIPTQFDPDAIAAWTAFRGRLVAALRSGAQSANGERSLVHLLDVGVFLVWPHVVLPFGDEVRLAPQAIKAAMRAAGVLAVNRADRQDDRHAFPARTAIPTSPATASSRCPSTSGRMRSAAPSPPRLSCAHPHLRATLPPSALTLRGFARVFAAVRTLADRP